MEGHVSDETMLKLLEKIDQKMDRLEARLDKLEGEGIIQLKDGLSILGDTIDENFNPALDRGKKNLNNMNRVLKILGELSEDDTITAIEVLVENLTGLTDLMSKFKQVEDVVSILLDSFDDFFAYAMKEGLDIEEFSSNLKRFSFLMLNAFESGALNDLMESGVLDPSSIKTVGALGKSLATSGKLRQSAGPMKAAAAILNPDVQRAMGFLLTFAAHFGRTLEETNFKKVEM